MQGAKLAGESRGAQKIEFPAKITKVFSILSDKDNSFWENCMKTFWKWCILASFVVPVVPSAAGKSDLKVRQKIQLAQSSKKKNAVKTGRKNRITTRETRFRTNKKSINFEEATLRGDRKRPQGTMIGSLKSNRDYDLIKLRLRWHPEMIQSTSSLESGR